MTRAEKKEKKGKGGENRGGERKDPAVAALIALAGGLFLLFPGGGYIYLDRIKEGIIYGVLGWILNMPLILLFLGISVLTGGLGVICFPITLIPFLYVLLVTYDTYKLAKGERTILPRLE